MSKFCTHYDNLKITRNAPDAVIRAAYKALVQQCHPDKFQGSEQEALRLTKIINQSYDVLINPNKRAEHDQWISRFEYKAKTYDDYAHQGTGFEENRRRSRYKAPEQPGRTEDVNPNESKSADRDVILVKSCPRDCSPACSTCGGR